MATRGEGNQRLRPMTERCEHGISAAVDGHFYAGIGENFSGANLTGANLYGAKLTGAIVTIENQSSDDLEEGVTEIIVSGFSVVRMPSSLRPTCSVPTCTGPTLPRLT